MMTRLVLIALVLGLIPSFVVGFAPPKWTSFQVKKTLAMSTAEEFEVLDTPETRIIPTAEKMGSLSRVELEEFIVKVRPSSVTLPFHLLITSPHHPNWKLEKLNPTPDAAFSPLLNGVWEIISTGSVTSLGLIGFQALKAFPGDMFDIKQGA
jgi:hypothetical protein